MMKMHRKKTKYRKTLTEQCSMEHCFDCKYKPICDGCREGCDAKFCQVMGGDWACNSTDCGIPCRVGLPYLMPDIEPEDFEKVCDLSGNHCEAEGLVKVDSNVWGVSADYMVDIRLIIGPRGISKNCDLRSRLRLGSGSRLYLGFCVPDKYLDMFDEIEGRWEQIAEFGFDGVLSPNFSIYRADPMSSRIVSEWRKRREIRFGSKHVNMIPEVYLDDRDGDKYLDWVARCNPSVVYVTFQKQSSQTWSESWKVEMQGLESALKRLDCKFLVIGATSANRKKMIADILGEHAVYVDDTTYRVTACGMVSREEKRAGSHRENFLYAMQTFYGKKVK